jgi:hypothetical protein
MDVDSISSSCEATTTASEVSPEISKESASLKLRTQEIWLETPVLEIKGTTKPSVHTFSWVIYDKIADAKISEILKSSQSCQETVQYSYEGVLYELVVIFNPEKRPLRKAFYDTIVTKVLIIDTPTFVPSLLEKHLEELCTQNHIHPADTTLNLGYFSSWSSLRSLTLVNYPPVTPKTITPPINNKKAEEEVVPKSKEAKPSLAPTDNPSVAPKMVNPPIDNKKAEEEVVPKSTEPKVESRSWLRWLSEFFFGSNQRD